MVKIRDWRQVKSHFLGVDLRVATYGDYKFLLEKRKGVLSGRRWKLEIYTKEQIIVCTSYPNLMIAKAKAEEWLNKNYGSRPKGVQCAANS